MRLGRDAVSVPKCTEADPAQLCATWFSCRTNDLAAGLASFVTLFECAPHLRRSLWRILPVRRLQSFSDGWMCFLQPGKVVILLTGR